MDSYGLIEYLINRNKKTVSRSELENITGLTAAGELYGCLEILTEESFLIPMVKCGTNGNLRYPIYNKYHIRIPEKIREEYPESQEEIRRLHPLMIANGYLLKHPELFSEFREALLAVNGFLFHRWGKCQFISRKERSFELFSDEKFLENGTNSRFTGMLEHMDIGKDELAFYDTPECCFPDYVPVKKENMTILICENKDIWFNIRRIMFEDHLTAVFGKEIDGVLLGNGNQAAEYMKLTEYTAYLGADSVEYLYWGDVDREGFDIFRRVCTANPGLKIGLFIAGYRKMIDLAQGKKIPESYDRRMHGTYEDILSLFEILYAGELRQLLEENKRLPQEIISYEVLKSNKKEFT